MIQVNDKIENKIIYDEQTEQMKCILMLCYSFNKKNTMQ